MELNLFDRDKNGVEGEEPQSPTAPTVPLSPMKKAEEIELVLQQYDDNESQILAIREIIKKDRKKTRALKQALVSEMDKNSKLTENIQSLNDQLEKLRDEITAKDQRIVKTFGDYMTTYEELLKLRNEKGGAGSKASKKSK